MRVIAGEFRGRTLKAPPGRTTRPILDRVKTALFDWLGSRLAQPGTLPPLAVLDIFSGGGSLGIEALSRGATSCVFIETDQPSLQYLRDNIEKLGLTKRARILAEPAEAARPTPASAEGFGLIFLDPPYRLSEDVTPTSIMGRVVANLGIKIPVTAGALALWRHDAAVTLPPSLSGWASIDRRVWGTMAITMFVRPSLT